MPPVATQNVAKIILECGDALLFSIKRAPGKPHKDRKLELLGGHMEAGESPSEGLIRELREEEETGLLAEKALRLLPAYEEIIVENSRHFIFRMPLEPEDLGRIRPSPSESFGYRLIPRTQPVTDPVLFTPKTVGIFAALTPAVTDAADPPFPDPPSSSSTS
jgi:8-oxo-dGTP pyrophosphatase MutT (NUDIX family)